MAQGRGGENHQGTPPRSLGRFFKKAVGALVLHQPRHLLGNVADRLFRHDPNERIEHLRILADQHMKLIGLDPVKDDPGGLGRGHWLHALGRLVRTFGHRHAGILRDVGIDPAGHHHRHMDIASQCLGIEALGEKLYRRFGGSIHRLPREGDEATHARDIADMRLGAGLEVRKEGLDHVNLAPEVHVDHALDDLVGQVGKINERLDHAGAVDDGIDLAVLCDHLLRQLMDPFAIGHIGHMGRKPLARYGARKGRKAPGPKIDRRDPCATRQERQHQRPPDAASAACNDEDFVLDFHGLSLRVVAAV